VLVLKTFPHLTGSLLKTFPHLDRQVSQNLSPPPA
jgi:hypothetical protein